MDKNSPIDSLDTILLYISKATTSVNNTSFEKIYELSSKEANEILYKLLDDGFIRQSETGMMNQSWYIYYITFNGRLFIENGGYKKQKELEDLNETISAQNEMRIVRNEQWLLRGTWAAAIVGLCVLLWQIFLYFYPVHANYPYWIWEKVK